MMIRTQTAKGTPKSKLSAVMFVNFLTIGCLGAIYCFYFATGDGLLRPEHQHRIAHSATVQSSERSGFSSGNALVQVASNDGSRRGHQNVRVGSTAQQIDDAFLQCQQYSDACEKSWYEDELERWVILKPFALDAFEVTVSQFHRFVEAHEYKTDAEKQGSSYRVDTPYEDYAIVESNGLNWKNTYLAGSADLPVVHVTQRDAAAYCESLQKRLPTEAEWEYAAGAHTNLTYPWGNYWDESQLHWGTAADSNVAKPVGSFAPNALGHYDAGTGAFIKGTSRFDTNVANARNAVRRLESVDYSGEDVGFRCVEELGHWPEHNHQ